VALKFDSGGGAFTTRSSKVQRRQASHTTASPAINIANGFNRDAWIPRGHLLVPTLPTSKHFFCSLITLLCHKALMYYRQRLCSEDCILENVM
jgi:hypothetical protein